MCICMKESNLLLTIRAIHELVRKIICFWLWCPSLSVSCTGKSDIVICPEKKFFL